MMSRKGAVIWLSFVLVSSFIVIIIEIAPVVEAPIIWYVDDVPGVGPGNPPEDFTSIQDAINASIDGDTVFVYNGTYYEHVVVNKTINLTGENRDTTIIDGGGIEDVVRVTADWVNITGFTITKGGFHGIYIDSITHSIIMGNNILNSTSGIYLYSSSNNTIINNNALNNFDGIFLDASINNEITDNDVSNSWDGIELWQSSNNTIANNRVFSSGFDGIELWQSSNNTFTNNIIYSSFIDGMILRSSDNNKVTNNNISNSTYGITIEIQSTNNTINNNIISFNNESGINNVASNYNIVTNNTVLLNNNYGIFLQSSFDNLIYHNNIINNTFQAYDDTDNGNQWDNGYPNGGNYWSDFDEPSEGAYDDYKGPDQNIMGSDGIVDNGTIGGGGRNPYVIDTNSRDNYPLIEPYQNYTILKQGWNLISIPLIQNNQGLTKVLELINGYYDAVQWYDITDTNDPWKHHKVGKPYGNDLSEINETMGFWIHIIKLGATIFLYNGTIPILNQTITLHPGWNMVGYPSLRTYNRTEGLNNLTFGQEVDSIWTYDAATQKWKEIGASDYFELGRGYWIHAKTTCEWEVPL